MKQADNATTSPPQTAEQKRAGDDKAPRVLRRPRRGHGFLAQGNRLVTRVAARTAAVGFLALGIFHALIMGGHLDYPGSPWLKTPGKIASLFGLAADNIHITGLMYQEPATVLTAIGVAPGGSLIGFDASLARKLLENLDWAESAKVLRLFPNKLEIDIVERVPFAVWQRDGAYYVIDRTGAAMSSLDPARMPRLILVSGEGAQAAVSDLVNQLEAHPALISRVEAASRVGQRRWTLHLDNGVSVALPEIGVEAALAEVNRLGVTLGLFQKGIAAIDLRLPDRVTVAVAEQEQEKKDGGKIKISRQ